MTDKITDLENQLLKLSKELEQLKNKKTEEISAPNPVFKRGYAYKNGDGIECCILSKKGTSETYPIIALRIDEETERLETFAYHFMTNGVYHRGHYSSLDLIHSTERLYDASLIDPAECSSEQFNVGWVYQDGERMWLLITHIWDDDRKFPIIGSDTQEELEELEEPRSFNSLGKYYNNGENDSFDLILSTGKPYQQWKREI